MFSYESIKIVVLVFTIIFGYGFIKGLLIPAIIDFIKDVKEGV